MKKIIIRVLLFLGVIIITLVILFIDIENYVSKISEGTKIPDFQTPGAALLVIDIQEATSGMSSLTEIYTKQAPLLIKNVNVLIDSAQKNNIPVIYIKNETTNWLINLLDNSMEKGSVGAELDKRLRILTQNIVSKTRMDAFSNPMLDSLLLSLEVDILFVTGLDAAYCVNHTMQAAHNRGYNLVVIKDALISENDSLMQVMIDDFQSRDIRIISLGDFPLKKD